MTSEMPFSEDMMTIIMGIQPDAPGQHGRVSMPMPTQDAISTITKIKDLCEEFLMSCGKCDEDVSEPEEPMEEEEESE